MTHLSISLLGPFQVTLDGQPVTSFKSDKVRALLAYLTVEAGRPHRRESLAGLLWPEYPDKDARSNLRYALSDLRRAIDDRRATLHFLLVTRDTIQFNPASDHRLDVAAFAEGVVAGDTDRLQQAVALYRGSFLEGFSVRDSAAFEEWALFKREQFGRQMLNALYRLAAHHEERGEYEPAQAHAWRQVELEPWQEEAHRQLMRVLALGGQRSAALAQYETCRRLLAEELGVEPAPETKQLYEQIRDGALEHPPGVSAAGFPARESRLVGACPYRGLGAFREADAPFFFGREDFAGRLLKALGQQPMVVVIVGSSGCGKSSAVFAGLLPHLRDGADWLIAHFRPGGRPFYALAAALLPMLEPDLGETDRLIEARKLAEALREGEIPLYDAVERALEKSPAASRLLFVVDQFEELYTLCPEPETRRRFLDGLLAAVEAGSERRVPPLALLLTLRADFMGHALAHRPFVDALQDAALMMGPMSRDELRRAIEKPAEKQGAALEAGLVERLLDDVGGAPGNLPLLEFALTLLWEGQTDGWLTHAGYEEIGRVEGALARYADEVFGELDEAEQEGAQRIFVQLVRPGEGTEDTRRVATRAELGDEALIQRWGLVQHLADRRLVVTGQDATGTEIVEVVHEALIQRWGQLRAWMDADRAFRTWQEGLRAALRGWETSERDEGSLLRGVSLAQAEGWLAEREGELSAAERDFIRASVTLRERRQAERERRRRWTILALAGGLVIAIVLAIFAFNARATAQREAAVNHSLVLAANAAQAFENGKCDLALALALEAVSMDQPPPEAKRTLSAIALGPGTRAVLTGHSNSVRDVAFGPDVQTALSGSCGQLDSDGACIQGELILWDLEAGTELRRFAGHTGWVNAVAFNPDGQTALSGSDDATLILWDVETGEVVRRFEGHTGGVNSVAFSSDGQTALSGSDDATLILWDVTTGEAIRRLQGHAGGVNSVAFSPDGQTALSGSDDAALILWDVATGEAIRRLEGHTERVLDLAFTPDGRSVLSASDDMSLRLWNLETGEEIRQRVFPSVPILLAISPDGRTAVHTVEQEIRLRDIVQWQEHGRLLGHSELSPIQSIAISPDGRLILTASKDGSLTLWNLAGQAELDRFQMDEMLFAVAASPDGRRLLVGGATGDALLWDVERGQVIRRLKGDGIPIDPGGVAFSPDGRVALVAAEDVFGGSGATSLTLWDIETGEEIRRFEGHTTYVRSVAFSSDGRLALSGSQSLEGEPRGDLILWDVETGQAIRRFDTTDDITSIVFSADGGRALTGSAYFANATLWDVATGREIHRFEGPTSLVFAVAFGPDETTALSASEDGSLILWDIETGNVIRRYLGHDRGVWGLDISPDGRYVISGAEDGAVILWNFATGQELRRFTGHMAWVPDVIFNPDGQTAFSVSLDGALIQWQIADQPLDELIGWIRANRYVRELTCDERAQYRVEPLCGDGVAP